MSNFKVFCFVILILVVGEFVRTSNGEKSANKIYPGLKLNRNGPWPCDTNDDCQHFLNATCVQSVCECNGSRFCERTRMRIVVTRVGEYCEESEDCNIQNSKCDKKGGCECRGGYVASQDGKKCLKISAGLGDQCEDSVQCYRTTSASDCRENKCVCQQQTHPFDGACYRDVELGQGCAHTGECSLVTSSRCADAKCGCLMNFTPSADNRRCLLVATSVNATCVEDVQCAVALGGGSACMNGVCRCRELYQLKEMMNLCVRDMLIGDVCAEHSECHGPFPGKSRLMCVEGNCMCQSRYEEIEGNCILNFATQLKSFSTAFLLALVVLSMKFY